ncbi:GNAT family N-acetyltransferase [Stenotrophomonas maltophilia]|uniref:GNAT family N-acetyltransferase n=1 Tax=Stenotrophomonas riyadhensis TaxID=2859893 RepID=A0ABT2XLI7_9GAMM|nr:MULTISPECIES: GNAT family protein [unclassified Stenotrophomonas]MBH1619865.1 GNAT family N-acetyltransferase [Stenotrophomonas maltophilia]MCV0326788.1 GNAT family N-acetyltransferase [Stenotrophomonas sp. CFS3442]MRI43531.1 N-acetyltransferase [Stenotrophomonas sp. MH181796]HEL4245993.1 GNAT family N-acetyltransferase [Stenotrophomonas maltophilia]
MPASRLPSLPDTLPARLRALRVDDAVAWSRYLSLPGVIEHTSWGDISEAALRQQVASYRPASPDPRWALVDAHDRLIGTFGLNGIDLQHGRGELAYDLDPHWQGQGLATQAARAVLDWGHAVRSLTRIQATVLDSNARSIAVLERLGMQREGLLCAYRKVRGHPRNFWMYAHLEGTVASPL